MFAKMPPCFLLPVGEINPALSAEAMHFVHEFETAHWAEIFVRTMHALAKLIVYQAVNTEPDPLLGCVMSLHHARDPTASGNRYRKCKKSGYQRAHCHDESDRLGLHNVQYTYSNSTYCTESMHIKNRFFCEEKKKLTAVVTDNLPEYACHAKQRDTDHTHTEGPHVSG